MPDDRTFYEETGDGAFRGEIVVASRIVDYLSSGLYESPAACLKELVNNSYDADATEVSVFVRPDANRIIIQDNGHGMTRDDFVHHFSRISESHKRDDSELTRRGRLKVGKIGIGFIAANEICDIMEIYSTKAGSTELLRANINFFKMRGDVEDRRRGEEGLAKADYQGEVTEADAGEHYTQIFLTGVRGEAREILVGAKARGYLSGHQSLYGLSSSSVEKLLRNREIKSWTEFDSYSQNILKVALNVPVAYHEHWVPPELFHEVEDFHKEVKALDFSLRVDGSEALKPIVLTPDDGALISRFELKGQYVSAKGYFYGQSGTIRPRELQGLLLRIRQAAVGEYDHTFLAFSPTAGSLIQRWISAEIWADDRLEDAMNIDRRTLRTAHPAYVELRDAIHEHLSRVISEVRAKLYGTRSEERKQERASMILDSINQLADDVVASDAPEAAKELKSSWTTTATKSRGITRVLRKFTVAELYRIILDVAEETLSAEQKEEFIRRLTARLSK